MLRQPDQIDQNVEAISTKASKDLMSCRNSVTATVEITVHILESSTGNKYTHTVSKTAKCHYSTTPFTGWLVDVRLGRY